MSSAPRWSAPVRMGEIPDELKEDERTGVLRLVVHSSTRKQPDGGHVHDMQETAVRRGVIRFLVLVIDGSKKMSERDMRPSRLHVTKQVVSTFIDSFFDQNPISQLAIIELRDGSAQKITELSGNARHHKSKLEEHVEKARYLGAGMPSMRAGLEAALHLLEMQPSYGTREVLQVYGSLSTTDRGDIFRTIEKMKAASIKVSTVGLGAEVYVARAISDETAGTYRIATNAQEMLEMVVDMTRPPPVYDTPQAGGDKPAAGMWVGFPRKTAAPVAGWQCPRCHDVVGDVPADCQLCGLKLLSSAHLARSFHHLFPVPAYSEHTGAHVSGETEKKRQRQSCGGCGVEMGYAGAEAWYSCTRCASHYCALCDGFVHELLHVCPGCEDMQGRGALQEMGQGLGQAPGQELPQASSAEIGK